MINEVRFRDLSWPLKAAVVMSWIVGVLTMLSFILGFISAWLEVPY